jgi:hypothetical protein
VCGKIFHIFNRSAFEVLLLNYFPGNYKVSFCKNDIINETCV